MATVTVILVNRRKKKDGTYPISIRVTHGAKTRYKAIGHSVKHEQFKPGASDWVRRHPDALYINSVIEDVRAKMIEKITRLRLDRKEFDFDFVLSDAPASGHTIGEILSTLADRYNKSQSVSQEYRHISLKRQVIECFGKDVLLSDIKLEGARALESHFRNVEGNKQNTVARKIKYLRSAFREAQRMWPEVGQNPFELVRIKSERVERVKLDREQLNSIEKLPLMGFFDVVRDAFMAAYYMHGMRFGKIATLQKKQVGDMIVKYRMAKGNQYREIEIHPKLRAIIEKYMNTPGELLFPILKSIPKDKKAEHFAVDEANSMVNKALKKIALLVGISEKITFHVAKHSFAQMAKRAGIDPWVMKDSLGHTDFKTTEQYLKSLDDDHINKAISGLF